MIGDVVVNRVTVLLLYAGCIITGYQAITEANVSIHPAVSKLV